MHVKALLLDLDGTLIDSYKDIAIHLNRTLQHFGKPSVEVESVRYRIGGGARELLREFFPQELLQEALAVFREYYLSEPVIHTKPFEGIREVLCRAKEKGVELAVVTNKMEELSRLILERLELMSYFSLLVGGDTYKEKKPSPLPLVEVLKALVVPPQEALMVGDTETDLKAGRLAGTKRALALWGYVKVSEEVPEYTLQRPADILRFI
ncbi:MAG: HAD-IA family hydrolase [Aquificaceae bacterium]|nr:HAD-IA family hydrolase [Aquificaceae bacterium]MCX8060806.1 HAD-IA family hydrolase [Aquificaceae bacterium]MDW8097361.1 HAD-IA family hydrolase [Aquificaceae bacterium]